MACTYGVFSPRPVRTTAGISIVAIQAAWLTINTAASGFAVTDEFLQGFAEPAQFLRATPHILSASPPRA